MNAISSWYPMVQCRKYCLIEVVNWIENFSRWLFDSAVKIEMRIPLTELKHVQLYICRKMRKRRKVDSWQKKITLSHEIYWTRAYRARFRNETRENKKIKYVGLKSFDGFLFWFKLRKINQNNKQVDLGVAKVSSHNLVKENTSEKHKVGKIAICEKSKQKRN